MEPTATPAPNLVLSLQAVVEDLVKTTLENRFGLRSVNGSIETSVAEMVEQQLSNEAVRSRIEGLVSTTCDERLGSTSVQSTMAKSVAELFEKEMNAGAIGMKVDKSIEKALQQRFGPVGTILNAQFTLGPSGFQLTQLNDAIAFNAPMKQEVSKGTATFQKETSHIAGVANKTLTDLTQGPCMTSESKSTPMTPKLEENKCTLLPIQATARAKANSSSSKPLPDINKEQTLGQSTLKPKSLSPVEEFRRRAEAMVAQRAEIPSATRINSQQTINPNQGQGDLDQQARNQLAKSKAVPSDLAYSAGQPRCKANASVNTTPTPASIEKTAEGLDEVVEAQSDVREQKDKAAPESAKSLTTSKLTGKQSDGKISAPARQQQSVAVGPSSSATTNGIKRKLDTANSTSSVANVTSDNLAPSPKKPKKKKDPSGFSDGPPMKFAQVTPRLPASRGRGYPRIVDLEVFDKSTDKQMLTMADIVATILWNHSKTAFDKFLAVNIRPNFSFIRREKNGKDKNFVIQRKWELCPVEHKDRIFVIVGYHYLAQDRKPFKCAWNMMYKYVIEDTGKWKPQQYVVNGTLQSSSMVKIEEMAVQLGEVLLCGKIWVRGPNSKVEVGEKIWSDKVV
ncbi:MAG: hypothetical protein Q9164_001432 [Protoblastenia rupestris]